MASDACPEDAGETTSDPGNAAEDTEARNAGPTLHDTAAAAAAAAASAVGGSPGESRRPPRHTSSKYDFVKVLQPIAFIPPGLRSDVTVKAHLQARL